MSDDPIKLTDEAVEKFFGSLVLNFISLTVWSQPMIQDLVNIAFKDDIDAAKDSVEKAIESMEKEANKDEQSE